MFQKNRALVLRFIESRLFGRICYVYIRRKGGIMETCEEKAKWVILAVKMVLSRWMRDKQM